MLEEGVRERLREAEQQRQRDRKYKVLLSLMHCREVYIDPAVLNHEQELLELSTCPPLARKPHMLVCSAEVAVN